MRIALALQDAGAFPDTPFRKFDLDTLCAGFGIVAHDRHTAAGDAFLTAQIFLSLLALAHKHGLPLASLVEIDPTHADGLL